MKIIHAKIAGVCGLLLVLVGCNAADDTPNASGTDSAISAKDAATVDSATNTSSSQPDATGDVEVNSCHPDPTTGCASSNSTHCCAISGVVFLWNATARCSTKIFTDNGGAAYDCVDPNVA
jgi:hypothetical protein